MQLHKPLMTIDSKFTMKGGDSEMKKLIPILLVALLLAVGLALPGAGLANADDNDNGPRTPGFWKNHSESGLLSYHSTWDEKAAGDEKFLATGLSYVDVLHTPPSRGQAYFILARQYIAAELNVANGSPISQEVSDTLLEAQALLIQYGGDCSIPKSEKMLAIQLAQTLDDYNNGLLTP
jgi:hypothetical protein